MHVPLGDLVAIDYVRGPMTIKSEDTFLVGYVIFDKQPGPAEVDVVEAGAGLPGARPARAGDLVLPAGRQLHLRRQLREPGALAKRPCRWSCRWPCC